MKYFRLVLVFILGFFAQLVTLLIVFVLSFGMASSSFMPYIILSVMELIFAIIPTIYFWKLNKKIAYFYMAGLLSMFVYNSIG